MLARCGVSQQPLTYLGVPLKDNPCASSFWVPIVQKISGRLESWEGIFFFHYVGG